MSNFTFLKTNWPDLAASALEAEQQVNSAPRTSCFHARRTLELGVKWLYANDNYLKKPYADNLAALIHRLRLRSTPSFPKVPERSRREILTIQACNNFFTSRHNAIYSAHYTQ